MLGVAAPQLPAAACEWLENDFKRGWLVARDLRVGSPALVTQLGAFAHGSLQVH